MFELGRFGVGDDDFVREGEFEVDGEGWVEGEGDVR